MSAIKNFWISVLSGVLAYTVLISLPILYQNTLIDIAADSPIYFMADNLMLLIIPAGLVLLVLRDVNQVHYREQFSIIILSLVFTGSLILAFVSLWRIGGSLSAGSIVYSSLIALNITGLSYLSLVRVPDAIAIVPDKQTIILLNFFLLIIVLISYGLRQFIPASAILDYGLAPLMIFIVPGLALVNLFLAPEASLIERLFKSIPVSIGWYAVTGAWAFQTGILITANSLYAFAILAILCAITGFIFK